MTDHPEQLTALAQAAKTGDREAFGRLYDLTAQSVYRFLIIRAGHRETAEDLLSTVWLKAWHAIRACPPEHFVPWLYTIARNSFLDDRRHRQWEVDWESLTTQSDGHNIAHQADVRQAVAQVRHQLATLTPEQQQVLIMRLWDDLSYDDIALVLKRSPTSCRMLMVRAVKSLRAQLPQLLLLTLLYGRLH